MSAMTSNKVISMNRLLPLIMIAGALLVGAAAQAASPGITGPVFNLTAQPAFLNQPDGNQVYSWGYGCNGTPAGHAPAAMAVPCPTMQVPGPTLIVTEGQIVTVNLTNGLPAAAGNTSILFPGFNVCVGTLTGASATSAGTCTPSATPSPVGLLTSEAAPAGTVTYSFYAGTPGTRAYYSGTQGDLQIEMGLYGAIIVIPVSTNPAIANCSTGLHAANLTAKKAWSETDFRLSTAAYDHPGTCYDREYLFQFAEMDANIHKTALAQVTAGATLLQVPTEPYRPSYYLINGRSMPDDMDPNFDGVYPHQPYNGNPHMHPGEQTLIRVIGQGRWEHPFHEHANHVRILARDGNLILSNSTITYPGTTAPVPALAGMLMFTTDTFPGQAFDGIFYFTGRGLNWDMYGHNPSSADANATLTCTPDASGYNTGFDTSGNSLTNAATIQGSINFWEWCADHQKPLQVHPFGDVPAGGPATLPDPNIFANGAWYGGTPYLGPDATLRAGNPGCATTTNANCALLQPSNVQANPANERGWAFMWHSHNEREITTNNVFPGGMLMMMLVDSREFVIDETN
jgi:FtsP/CotA-like multicopper oxidase with cupredoxin domain